MWALMRLPTRPRVNTRTVLWFSLPLLLGALCAQLFVLRNLPYSKASLGAVSVEEALNPKDPLVLDELDWHPARFQNDPSLDPIRAVTREHCPNSIGFALATCLTNVFARKFPHGAPSREFFDRVYDPVKMWNGHLSGEPGHCVSRSGLLATALLASGTPARVVQFFSSRGHTVIEVWEPGAGWRVLDPSFAGTVEAKSGRASAVALTTAPVAARWEVIPSLVQVQGVEPPPRDDGGWRQASIVYPEPWLYTRVGTTMAQWPLMGRFVMVGPTTMQLGLGQRLLRGGILLCTITLALVAIGLVVPAGRRSRANARMIDATLPETEVSAGYGQSTS